MKKGINIWSFPAGKPLEECFSLAKKAGFDGIEPALTDTGAFSLKSSESDMLKTREAARNSGIELTSLAAGVYWDYPFTSSDYNIRKKAMEFAERHLELAAVLGVDTVLMLPGAVGVDFIPGYEVVPYDRAYELSLEAFTGLAPVAASCGVNIGIENVWNKFLLSPLELRHFIDNIGSPYVGSYLDIGNIAASGYPEQWVRILGPRIKKVHFKDYRRQAGGLHGFVDLLAGDVDFPAVVSALREVEYDGYVIGEMIPGYAHWPEQLIYNTAASMERILNQI